MDYTQTLNTVSVVPVTEVITKGNPSLIEPGVKYFLTETLQNCKNTKLAYYNNLWNLSLFLFLTIGLGVFLYSKYKSKIEDEKNKKQRERKIREYIAHNIEKVKKEEQKKRGEMITNIPEFESEHHIRNKIFL